MTEVRYKIVRKFKEGADEIINDDVSLEEAQAHCSSPETSSATCKSTEGQELTRKRGPWFDCYYYHA